MSKPQRAYNLVQPRQSLAETERFDRTYISEDCVNIMGNGMKLKSRLKLISIRCVEAARATNF